MQVFVPGSARRAKQIAQRHRYMLPRTGFHALPYVHTDVIKPNLLRPMRTTQSQRHTKMITRTSNCPSRGLAKLQKAVAGCPSKEPARKRNANHTCSNTTKPHYTLCWDSRAPSDPATKHKQTAPLAEPSAHARNVWMKCDELCKRSGTRRAQAAPPRLPPQAFA